MFEKNLPIYLQLADRFKTLIVLGTWPPESYIPSVRELALEHQANPNTVMKALSELEALGLLITDRTVGKKVASDLALIEATKQSLLNQAMDDFIDQGARLGYSQDALIEHFMKQKGTL